MTLQLGTVTQVSPSVLVAADGSTVGMPVAAYATDGVPQVNDRVVFDTVDRLLVVLANLSSVRDGIPGEVRMFGTGSTPSGWLLCDGSSYLRTDYPRLFAAIGTTFGSADGTHFNVPNLTGRFPTGNTPVGQTGGTSSHSHGQSSTHTHSVGAHSHTLSQAGWAQIDMTSGGTVIINRDSTGVSFTGSQRGSTSSPVSGSQTANAGAGLDGSTDSRAAFNTSAVAPPDTDATAHTPPYTRLLFAIRA